MEQALSCSKAVLWVRLSYHSTRSEAGTDLKYEYEAIPKEMIPPSYSKVLIIILANQKMHISWTFDSKENR